MLVTCNNCSTSLQIDESKATSERFAVRCPKCQNAVQVQVNKSAANGTADNLSIPSSVPAQSAVNRNWEIPPIATFQRPGLYHEEKPAQHSHHPTHNLPQKQVLICLDGERSQKIAQLLDEAGYTVYLAENPAQATEKIRDADVDVLVLSSDFALSFNGYTVLTQLLNMLPAVERRKIFTVSIEDNLQTFNTHEAFLRNLNLIVNRNDIHHLPSIINRALRDYNELYRYFNPAAANVVV